MLKYYDYVCINNFYFKMLSGNLEALQKLPYLRTFELRTTVHTNMSARMSAAISDSITDVLAAERGTT